ncbi:MAG: DUF2946 family protein [Burkholderiales bacterium]|nr:DUF2946 family protein [Burkholderiales bacterium]
MARRTLPRTIAAWLAMWAVLLPVWAPVASQAMGGPAAPGALVEICSASGTRWVAVDASEDAGSTLPAQAAADCPYCLHPLLGLAPPTWALALPSPVAAPPAPPAAGEPPVIRHGWSPAAPRAPPATA